MKEKFYISTAIAYTSGKPHIGNTYEIVLADAIARFKRLKGYDVYFQTGTDEHGEKIELKAKEAGVTPQEFVDEKAAEIKRIWDIMNTSYDKFVRTTDKNHERVVQDIFKKMYEKGDIYKGEYKGLYCTPCESFWTESQLVDGKCPDCGREVQEKREEAYFFRLSKYQDRLEKYIEEHPDFIKPEARKNEMLNNFIKPGLQDLCVSRSSFSWGIPVGIDPKHVVYVWLDALTNYITNIGYEVDHPTEEFQKLWPADLHLIGKDIIRFHTIYWPCFLMSLDLPLPKQVFGHPWLIMADGKMSKSKGNVIYADDLVHEFGVDAVRYYFLHEIPYASDGIFSRELLIDRINGDLVNILGNLVNRTVSMAHKYFDGTITNAKVKEDVDTDFIQAISSLDEKVTVKMDDLHIGEALDEIFDVLRKSNKYIDDTTPWILAKDETKKGRLETVLYNLLESIRICAIFLSPFLPDTSEKIFNQLNTQNRTYETKDFGMLESPITLNTPQHLFSRIDETVK
ncbi:MAG TPA: methionine--tRNA ligase [Candidatus Faecenecus gallistercoris]|uniref:Methionine--tRNA ligase n=1 Tax=Candidatus Faecenecus gallistercoris TaxID=2840793 RepID=A0A9D0YZQ7_9FIRM|nr:methionine--tRNA ligase [Candidatus Faecenecus gallistercoris]